MKASVLPHNKPNERLCVAFTEMDSSSLWLIKLSAQLTKATEQEIITVIPAEKQTWWLSVVLWRDAEDQHSYLSRSEVAKSSLRWFYIDELKRKNNLFHMKIPV